MRVYVCATCRYLAARPDCVDIGVRPMLEPTADPSSPQTENRVSNPEGK